MAMVDSNDRLLVRARGSVVDETPSDVEVAQPGLELRLERMILTLKDPIIYQIEGECVVCPGDGEAIQVHSVWDAGHPRWIGGEVKVEGIG